MNKTNEELWRECQLSSINTPSEYTAFIAACDVKDKEIAHWKSRWGSIQLQCHTYLLENIEIGKELKREREGNDRVANGDYKDIGVSIHLARSIIAQRKIKQEDL